MSSIKTTRRTILKGLSAIAAPWTALVRDVAVGNSDRGRGAEPYDVVSHGGYSVGPYGAGPYGKTRAENRIFLPVTKR